MSDTLGMKYQGIKKIIIIIHIFVWRLMVITSEALWPESVLVRVRKGKRVPERKKMPLA